MSVPCFLRENKEKILSGWEELSRATFPAATLKSRTAVRDHLPQLVDALCEMLETGDSDRPKKLSEIHGRQRFAFGDYSISQVMGEYWLLKTVMFDKMEAGQEIDLQVLRVINRFFESAATGAAAEFSKLRENELHLAAQTLLGTNRDLERFAAIAAHDLRSPVATIAGFADLGLEDCQSPTDPAAVKFARIKDVSMRMIHLIDQLLGYSDIGKSAPVMARFSLSEAAEDAKGNLAVSIADTKAVIQIERLPEITGTKILFTQLFQNLFSNSLKFRADTRPPLIIVKSWHEGDAIRIQVKDNGVGFDPAMNQEIFEAFKRGDNSQGIRGSGLGLATVNKIVSLHGGKIMATGAVNRGAEFDIDLPLSILA